MASRPWCCNHGSSCKALHEKVYGVRCGDGGGDTIKLLGTSQVRELGDAVVVHEDVVSLDVCSKVPGWWDRFRCHTAVHDPHEVQVTQTLQDLLRVRPDGVLGKGVELLPVTDARRLCGLLVWGGDPRNELRSDWNKSEDRGRPQPLRGIRDRGDGALGHVLEENVQHSRLLIEFGAEVAHDVLMENPFHDVELGASLGKLGRVEWTTMG